MSWNYPHHFTQDQLLRRALFFGVLAVALFGFAVAANCQERTTPQPFRAAVSSYVAFSSIDTVQTATCLSTGRCREANKALAPMTGKTAVFVAAKAAITTGVVYGLINLHKTHPKAATWIAIGAAGFQAAVVGLNVRTARRFSK